MAISAPNRIFVDRAGESRLVLAGDGHVAVVGDLEGEARLDEAETTTIPSTNV